MFNKECVNYLIERSDLIREFCGIYCESKGIKLRTFESDCDFVHQHCGVIANSRYIFGWWFGSGTKLAGPNLAEKIKRSFRNPTTVLFSTFEPLEMADIGELKSIDYYIPKRAVLSLVVEPHEFKNIEKMRRFHELFDYITRNHFCIPPGVVIDKTGTEPQRLHV